jgi:mono/diheme cytochrome c family protein
MAKLLTSIIVMVTVGAVLGCQADGMLIAQRLPEPPAGDLAMEVIVDEVAQEKLAVQDILQSNCGICHGLSSTRPPHTLAGRTSPDGAASIADINDIDALVQAGLIVPGWPEESPLMKVAVSGQMPPTTSGLPPVPDAELRRLEKFIVRMDPPTRTEVERILMRNCGSCHGRVDATGLPINDIVDLELQVAAGFIVPGDRDLSALYTRILDGDMPPADATVPSVSNWDLARLGGYIDLMR